MQVAKYLQENDEEQLSLTELSDKMKEFLCNKGSDEEAYSLKHLKRRLLEHFGDAIVFSEINGKPNVVTFLSTANKILSNFYSNKKEDNSESEKLRLVETVGNIIKNDVKSIPVPDFREYPGEENMQKEQALSYLPESLCLLLRSIMTGKDIDLKVASIGQAIMQAARPRVIIAPLQLGLGLQCHHHFGSRFLMKRRHFSYHIMIEG